MSMLLPVSVSFHKQFKPLSNTPATSLVENLPHGRHAKILLLGDGAPRKILYTVYSEEDNGKSRKRNSIDAQDSRGRTTRHLAVQYLLCLVLSFETRLLI